MVKEYDTKYLRFRLSGRYPKTEYWVVFSQQSGEIIAHIKWCCPWRQYAMFPEEETVYSVECLNDISKFIQALMDEHKKKR